MKDKLYFVKTVAMKTAFFSLAAAFTLSVTGCAQKEAEISTTTIPKTQIAKINQKDSFSQEALHDAVRAKDIELVKVLVENKAEVNGKDYYGYTPLHLAVRLNQVEISEYLIENGANINTLDNYKDTPLLDATRDNYTQITKLLICKGSKRITADRYEMTPLHYSAKNKNRLISEMLLAQDVTPYCIKKDEAKETKEAVTKMAPESEAEQESQTQVPLAQTEEFQGLYKDLNEEFKEDFVTWNAELTKDDLMVRFNNPVALFEKGSDSVNQGFIDILDNFFPRYLKILSAYKENIQEVRIEGHTSSEYAMAQNEEQRHCFNQELSQKRADAVKAYLLETINNEEQEWVQALIQSYGMGYENLILKADGAEDYEASRRVDFKIIKK